MIDLYQHTNKGYNPFLITPQLQIAQLNYSAEQELNNIVRLDIHHRTDEAFEFFYLSKSYIDELVKKLGKLL